MAEHLPKIMTAALIACCPIDYQVEAIFAIFPQRSRQIILSFK